MRARVAVGVDLGGSNTRVGLISERGMVLETRKEPTDKSGKDGTVITQQIIRLIKELHGLKKAQGKIIGIGVASTGPLDYARGGTMYFSSFYDFVPLTKPLTEEFKLPVYLHGDARAAVLAERFFGAGKKIRNLVYITFSTGIGGGAIVDDHLLLGRSGNAAEVGHIIVDTKYEIPCPCGHGGGHWEAYASGTNIPKFYETWHKTNNPAPSAALNYNEAKVIFTMAANKERFALDFLEELSRINARAVSSIIAAYDPELITIGGSVALHNPDFIIDGIKKYVEHLLEVPEIKITSLGDEIGVLGAAAAVFKKVKVIE